MMRKFIYVVVCLFLSVFGRRVQSPEMKSSPTSETLAEEVVQVAAARPGPTDVKGFHKQLLVNKPASGFQVGKFPHRGRQVASLSKPHGNAIRMTDSGKDDEGEKLKKQWEDEDAKSEKPKAEPDYDFSAAFQQRLDDEGGAEMFKLKYEAKQTAAKAQAAVEDAGDSVFGGLTDQQKSIGLLFFVVIAFNCFINGLGSSAMQSAASSGAGTLSI